jgi:hypothetical protein
MNVAEKLRRFGTISSEAIVGIGITIAELGILCLLLGWAEHMRSVPAVAWIWLGLGAALFVLGGLAAVSAGSKNRRRLRADRISSSSVPENAVQSEPEEVRE